MPSDSPSVSPSVNPANRLSSIRLSGSPPTTTLPNTMSSAVQPFMPPPTSNVRTHNRAMTAGDLHNAMEQEQENITNNLLKHIDKLRADKIRIEHELEAESEAVMNRLTRELTSLRAKLEAAGIPAPIEASAPGSHSPRSASRSPSRASSLSRRSISGANSPRLNALGATGSPVLGSTTGVPIMSPAPRRDSIEFRGRASTNASANGGEMLPPAQVPTGLERVLESLKHENGEYKKAIRELDDRYRCKQAECERQKEEIQNLKMEIAVLQRRRASTTGSVHSIHSGTPSTPDPAIIAPAPTATASGVVSNVARFGTQATTTEEKNTTTTTGDTTDEKSESPTGGQQGL